MKFVRKSVARAAKQAVVPGVDTSDICPAVPGVVLGVVPEVDTSDICLAVPGMVPGVDTLVI